MVAEPPAPGTYRAIDAWIDDFVIAGVGGLVLHAGVGSDIELDTVHYESAVIDLGGATIRGLGSRVYRPMLAVGDGGRVWRSDDVGETWTAVSGGTTADLHAVGFSNFDAPGVDAAVIVGDGVLLHSADQGLTWTSLPLPVEGARLRDVQHVLGVGWFAVGLDGVILFADNDGLQWTAQASPTDRDLLRVHESFDAGASVLVVAREGELLLRDGDQWTAVALDIDGELADADAWTLAMRDGRIARREFGTAADAYVPTDVDEPLPPLERIVKDSDPWDLDRTLLLAQDGRLILLAHTKQRRFCRR